MSNHYLIVDDARRAYFDCDKFFLEPEAQIEQPFGLFFLEANCGTIPTKGSNRFEIAEPEARALYLFLVGAAWAFRILSLDSDDYPTVVLTYERVACLYGEYPRGVCKDCKKESLLQHTGRCAACQWKDGQ